MSFGAAISGREHRRHPVVVTALALAVTVSSGCSTRGGLEVPIRGPTELHGCYAIELVDWSPQHERRLGFSPPAVVELTELHDENLLLPRERDLTAEWGSVTITDGLEQQYEITRDDAGRAYRVTRWPESPGTWIVLTWRALNAGLSVMFRPGSSEASGRETLVRWSPLDWGSGLRLLTATVERRPCS